SSNPQLSIEYQRYEMRVQYASKRYETILWQLEDAKLDENQGFFQLQVVDWATPPDFKFKPSKAKVILTGTFIGAMLGLLTAIFSNFFQGLKKILSGNPAFVTKKSSGKIMFLLPAILMMTAIILLTFQPAHSSKVMSLKFQSIIKTFFGDSTPGWVLEMNLLRAFAHVFLYFPLSAALFYAFNGYGHSSGKAAFSAFLTASAFGLADEAVKMFLPAREFDFADWTLDIAGILLGILFSLVIKFLFRKGEGAYSTI
ncbi:MAG: VanZ family protein, partial [Synergistaceae bacterium]|nr:VanZ family protein [Synergistaceae bacterium]